MTEIPVEQFPEDLRARQSGHGSRTPCPLQVGPSSGFTLIELIAVLAIIAGILSLVLPRLVDLPGAYLRTDAGRVASLIRYLNEASDTRRVYYRLGVDLDSETFRVSRSVDGKEFEDETEPVMKGIRLRGGVDLVDIVVPGLGKVTSGEVDLFFSPAGPPQAFILHMESADNVKSLTFNPYSGRVTVEDGYI